MKKYSLFKLSENFKIEGGKQSFFSITEYNFELFDTRFIVVPDNVEVIKIQVKNKNRILIRFQDFWFKINSIKAAQSTVTNFIGYLYYNTFYINKNYSGTINIDDFLAYEKDDMCSGDN